MHIMKYLSGETQLTDNKSISCASYTHSDDLYLLYTDILTVTIFRRIGVHIVPVLKVF